MLSEERRQQISAEEVFRNEVRRSLEAKPTPQSGGAHTWTLLNSSFALWVLSTLVVGTITGLYTRYETRTAEEVRKQESVESEAARRRELVRDLDIEIGNRIAYATLRLEEWKEEITRRKTQYTERGFYADVLRFFNNAWSDPTHNYSVFVEYRPRSFTSLLTELTTLVEPHERDDINRGLGATVDIIRRSSDDSRDGPASRDEQPRFIDIIMTVLDTQFQRPIWRTSVLGLTKQS